MLTEQEGSATPFWRARRPWLAVAALTTVYLLAAPGTRSEAEDAFTYAWEVERSDLRALLSGSNVSHLLFLPLARGLLNAARLVGADVRPHDLLRLVDCPLAAVAVVWLYAVLRRRLELSSFAATAGAAGFALSYGSWRYANEMEVYALTALLTVALCWLALSRLESAAALVGCAAVAAAGVLFYTLSVVPALVVAPLLLACGRRYRALLTYLLAFALLAGGVSYAAYRFVAPPDQDFLQYLTATAPGVSQPVRLGKEALLAGPTGLGHDLVSANFLFSYPRAARWLQGRFPALHLEEERYTAERAGWLVAALPLVTVPLLLLLAVPVAWLAGRRGRERRGLGATDLRLAAVLAWAGASALVVSVMSGAAPEAWIPLLPAVWIGIAGLVFRRIRDRAGRLAVAGLLAVLFVHNAVEGYWMIHSRQADFNVAKSAPILREAGAGDLVLTADGSTFVRYLRYQSAARVVDLTTEPVEDVRRLRETIPGFPGRVFATAGVLDPPPQLRVGAPDLWAAVQGFGASMRPHFCRVGDGSSFELYRYRGGGPPGPPGAACG
jgi:hypothetical protein